MADRIFEDPTTGQREEISWPGLWTLLFNFIYFAVKGIWTHAVVSFVLAIATGGLSWLIYPFFARQIVEKAYLKKGWLLVSASEHSAVRRCPYCAEFVRAEAIVCKHCRSELEEIHAADKHDDARLPHQSLDDNEAFGSHGRKTSIVGVIGWFVFWPTPLAIGQLLSIHYVGLVPSWLPLCGALLSSSLLLGATGWTILRLLRRQRIGSLGWAVAIFWIFAAIATVARVVSPVAPPQSVPTLHAKSK